MEPRAVAPGPGRQLPARGDEQASCGENPRRRRPSPTGKPARAGTKPEARPSGPHSARSGGISGRITVRDGKGREGPRDHAARLLEEWATAYTTDPQPHKQPDAFL